MSSNVYKWCVVPQCTNTSIKTPNKLFVYVPNKKTMRNKWLTLARRDPTALSLNTSIYFCEDHFDLPNDMENYMEYHVMGSVSQVRMKPGSIPKKFAWQMDTRKRTADTTERPKKQRQELIKESEKDLEERSIIIKHLELGETSPSSSVNQTCKMAMCRICLGKDMQLLDVDEVFVNNYNILTNLDLKCNEESIYSCDSCLEALRFCIEFREKCISSDLILKEEVKNKFKQNMDKDDTDTGLLEEEIKIEFVIDNDNKLDTIDILEYEIRGYGEDEDDKPIENKVKIEIEEECHDEERPKKALLRKSTRKKPRKTKGSLAIDSNIDMKESDQQEVEQALHCGICPKEFKTKDSLKKHLDHHKKDEWCEICSWPLLSVANMLGHRLNHIPETQANCTICDKSFTKSYFLECHYMKIHDMHPESSNQIVCKQCNKHFDTIKKLKTHIYNSHNDIRYSCDHCGLGFMQKWCLAKHVRQKHEQGPALKCELCDFTSPYALNMKNHKMRRHTKERVYCKVCGGPFANKKRLALHKCRVVATKVCDICGVEAKRMKAHMASHLDIYKYQCDKCPAKFKYRGTFQVHMDKHDEIRRYKCPLCPLSFYSPSVLIKHKRVHTGEKPYVCQICNKGFTGNHNLKLHMRIHGLNLINKKGSEADGNKITEDTVTEQNTFIVKRNKQSD